MAGHSVGEYTALVCAGALKFADALPLVRFRAEAMQEAVPVGEGAMAAIFGLDGAPLREACAEAAQGRVVEPVNFNAPGQTVIAGHKDAVARTIDLAKARGVRLAKLLPVSAPFHSSLLKPAADRLAARLGEVEFTSPRIPVINNVDVAVQGEPAAIRDALARQACNPVRWVELVHAMVGRGITGLVECGPGKVLTGLARRIVPDTPAYSLADDASLRQACDAVTK